MAGRVVVVVGDVEGPFIGGVRRWGASGVRRGSSRPLMALGVAARRRRDSLLRCDGSAEQGTQGWGDEHVEEPRVLCLSPSRLERRGKRGRGTVGGKRFCKSTRGLEGDLLWIEKCG